ncbi:ATP-dependent RNA helicase DDX25 isoform X2 [Nothoprocta perdicaria]|uniref:ATP-dependent RNA helicase DDX25 isoform X2 n=1 Tax=Nothoprocta perdicaria TaxID=30464 RepID=UPI000E1BBEA8|nr:ATP-dependent RNA helicase DDX25 isoform X2 [Nothoprocta perdicaria]
MGFNRPSKIQETALPMMLAHPPQNLIAQSQSGTGKTAAFVLAMLSRVNTARCQPQCLCLAPTFELALQIGRVVERMGQFCADVKVTFAVQGNRVAPGTRLKEQIVIGTPGTVLDWCFKRRLLDPGTISVFVLDEADIMIDTQGFCSQSIRVQRALRPDCQLLLFSATFKTAVWQFATQLVANPIVIKLRQEELTLSTIRQYYFVCESRWDKYRALCNIYGSITIGQAIIFCQTRKLAEWLSLAMTADGHRVAMLTAELTVEQRADVIQRFRDGKEKVLVTTNVCARGDHRGELQPARHVEQGARFRDLPAPHRARRPLRQEGHRLQHGGAPQPAPRAPHRGALPDGDQAVGPGRHGRAGEDRRVTPASESARIPRAVGKAGGVK